MYTVDKLYINEIIINKSRFICQIIPINNIAEIDNILESIKKDYKGATHYCYAYIINNKQKYSDDGEPTGTAGIPILNVLKNNNLKNILIVVIRYFGGIKLGAGGLLRAYTKAVTDCLSISNIIELKEKIVLKIEVSYENLNKVYNLINENSIKEKEYDNNIVLTIELDKDEYDNIKEQLENICINCINTEKI